MSLQHSTDIAHKNDVLGFIHRVRINIHHKMKSGDHCEKCQLKLSFRFIVSPFAQKFWFIYILIFLKMPQAPVGLIIPFDGSKLLIENSTLLHPLTNGTQNVTLGFENNEQLSIENLPWWCHYSSDLEDNEDESECHCEGPKLMKIPQNLPQITRLSIANAKFKVLREAGLRKYSSSLRDL